MRQGAPALVTFVTAGYPTADDTVPILLAMEDGGADIIELGVPFSDPIADGPAIQETNTVITPAPPTFVSLRSYHASQIALENNIDYATCLSLVREARKQGLKAPVLLMGMSNHRCDLMHTSLLSSVGYYNPMLAYGEDNAIRDAKEAGANGFIMVDLPPEEAITFREKCKTIGYAVASLMADYSDVDIHPASHMFH